MLKVSVIVNITSERACIHKRAFRVKYILLDCKIKTKSLKDSFAKAKGLYFDFIYSSLSTNRYRHHYKCVVQMHTELSCTKLAVYTSLSIPTYTDTHTHTPHTLSLTLSHTLSLSLFLSLSPPPFYPLFPTAREKKCQIK